MTTLTKLTSADRACLESRSLVDESAVLLSGSNNALAGYRSQLARSRDLLEKSRRQIETLTELRREVKLAGTRRRAADGRPRTP